MIEPVDSRQSGYDRRRFGVDLAGLGFLLAPGRGTRLRFLGGSLVLLAAIAGCGDIQPDWEKSRAPAATETRQGQFSDQLLTERLQASLVANATIPLQQIASYVFLGNGFLVGFVSSEAEAQAAVAAGQGVEGLWSLTPHLPVRTPSSSQSASPSPGETDRPPTTAYLVRIAVDSVLAALPANPPAPQVQVQILDGTAVLLGVVRSDADITSAVAAARQVRGVTAVRSLLMPPERAYDRYSNRPL